MKKYIFALILIFAVENLSARFEVGGFVYDFLSDGTLSVHYGYGDGYHSPSYCINVPSAVNYNGKTFSVTSIEGLGKSDNIKQITPYNYVSESAYVSKSGTINIPNSITKIGGGVFSYFSQLTSVILPSSVKFLGSAVFAECPSLISVEIPNSVTSIGGSAFEGCSSLTSITIPNSVTSIGDYAFQDCSGLTSVTIPSSVTSIGERAFKNCSNLTSISIPNSVNSIGDGAFSNCTELTAISIPSSVTHIERNAFKECTSLTSVEIPNTVTSIGDGAFDGCTGLSSISIPSSVTSIGDGAFDGCTGLTSISIPSSVTNIGENAFRGCLNLKSITIPSSITEVKKSSFEGCSSLTSVNIANSVTAIGEYAFLGCRSLSYITIPNSVKNIGDDAFSGCSSLELMTFHTEIVPYICSCPVKNIILGDEVKEISYGAFRQCPNLVSIEIPESVTCIGEYAFCGCSGLTSVILGNSVTSIGGSAFMDCTRLTSISIPESVTKIDSETFYGCSSLTSITIPNSITTIGDYAFCGCTSLTLVVIPESVTTIGERIFENCSETTSIIFLSRYVPKKNYEDQYERIELGVPAIFVPKGCKESYREDSPFDYCNNIFELNDPFEDVNADTNVNTADVVSVYNYITNGTGVASYHADVNLDGNVNTADVVAIYNHIIGEGDEPPYDDVDEEYDITFNCNNPEATIYIDGVNKGKISTSAYSLSYGTHTIRLTATGYDDLEKTINVTGNTKITLSQKISYYNIAFECNNPDATIYIDGINKGKISTSLYSLSYGTHTIRLTATGYDDLENTINVTGSTTITLSQELAGVKTYIVNGVSFKMVEVEGGTFQMGSEDGYSNEEPVHDVTLSSYSIGETEVTQALWKAVMGSNPSFFKGDNLPVEYVSWNDCQTFITKLNELTGKTFRLPTEAEWEFAARGGNNSQGYTYSGSNTLGDVAWYLDNSGIETHPVATKSPNELGIYDMSGNVEEWCQDWFDFDYYSSSSQTNPTGPSSGSHRVSRSGNFCDGAESCRTAYRFLREPTDSTFSNGLRLALSE